MKGRGRFGVVGWREDVPTVVGTLYWFITALEFWSLLLRSTGEASTMEKTVRRIVVRARRTEDREANMVVDVGCCGFEEVLTERSIYL